MNTTAILISITSALGWTLIHFIWQATAISLVLWIALATLQKNSARLRYALSCVALILMVASSGLTFWQMLGHFPTEASPAAQQTASGIFSQALPWIVALWGMGVILFGIRFVSAWKEVRQWRHDAKPIQDSHWSERFLSLQIQVGACATAQLLESAKAATPMVIGFLKPVVLVPAGFLTSLPASQVEALLAHELAHIRRHDYLVNLLQNIVEILFFYHPAVWWVGREMRRERENCCDDFAVEVTGGKLGYAQALAALAKSQPTNTPTLAAAADGGSLLERIQRLSGIRERAALAWPVIAMLFVTAALLLSIAGCDSDAQEPPEEPPTTKTEESAPSVDPFGASPEAKPEKQKQPAEDPFGSGIDTPEPAEQPAEDPFGSMSAPSKKSDAPSEDPFG